MWRLVQFIYLTVLLDCWLLVVLIGCLVLDLAGLILDVGRCDVSFLIVGFCWRVPVCMLLLCLFA